MPLMSTFQPPTQEIGHDIAELVQRIRCFDTNMAARVDGYSVADDATLYVYPVVDPHGIPWTLLSDEELRERRQWCMLPEMHDALQNEVNRRASIPGYYRD